MKEVLRVGSLGYIIRFLRRSYKVIYTDDLYFNIKTRISGMIHSFILNVCDFNISRHSDIFPDF